MSEKLRDALEYCQNAMADYMVGDAGGEHLDDAIENARQALSEAGDEPEMVTLGKRLKELRAKQRLEAEAAHDRQAWFVSHDASTRAGIYSLVIEIIEREFGHSLPKGEE